MTDKPLRTIISDTKDEFPDAAVVALGDFNLHSELWNPSSTPSLPVPTVQLICSWVPALAVSQFVSLLD